MIEARSLELDRLLSVTGGLARKVMIGAGTRGTLLSLMATYSKGLAEDDGGHYPLLRGSRMSPPDKYHTAFLQYLYFKPSAV